MAKLIILGRIFLGLILTLVFILPVFAEMRRPYKIDSFAIQFDRYCTLIHTMIVKSTVETGQSPQTVNEIIELLKDEEIITSFEIYDMETDQKWLAWPKLQFSMTKDNLIISLDGTGGLNQQYPRLIMSEPHQTCRDETDGNAEAYHQSNIKGAK